ncbi:MAG: uncharacterized protein A8A55_2634, partial [Amphiamblys sp. WSBS2006]
MDQKKFLSDFLSGCRKAASVRVAAVETASIHSAAELRVFLCSHEENLRTAATPEQTATFSREIKKYSFALAAKEAWEKIPPFKRMVPFPPSRVGDNPGTIEGLFKVVAEEIVTKKEELKEFVSLRKVKSIYAKWKQGFLDLMQK